MKMFYKTFVFASQTHHSSPKKNIDSRYVYKIKQGFMQSCVKLTKCLATLKHWNNVRETSAAWSTRQHLSDISVMSDIKWRL